MLRRLIAFLSLLTLGACAGFGPTLPPAPQTVSQTAYSYRLAPGDQLEINVWRNPEVSTKVPIRPDGKVTIPLIQDLQAAGKTPTQLGTEIEHGLAKYIREPSVSVIVTKVADNMRDQVRIAGEVVKPVSLPYQQKMTLLDAVSAAGGLSKLAAGNRAVLTRTSENKQYALRLDDLLRNADASANVELLPGDVITVPQSKF